MCGRDPVTAAIGGRAQRPPVNVTRRARPIESVDPDYPFRCIPTAPTTRGAGGGPSNRSVGSTARAQAPSVDQNLVCASLVISMVSILLCFCGTHAAMQLPDEIGTVRVPGGLEPALSCGKTDL